MNKQLCVSSKSEGGPQPRPEKSWGESGPPLPRSPWDTGSVVGVVALDTLNVLVMVSGIHNREAVDSQQREVRMANIGGTLRCCEGVRRTSGVVVQVEPTQPKSAVGASTIDVVGFLADVAERASVGCSPQVSLS